MIFVAGLAAFVVVATLNSGGYRYGAADQAFYIPAILSDLDPALFPRDRALVGPQSRYFFIDEIVAALVARTGWPIEAWFAAGYLLTLAVLYSALWHLGHLVFRSPYAIGGLIAAETLRHRITRTGVNTLEGYFHPRVLVFAIGVAAMVAYLKGRPWVALGTVALAGLLHPTTAAFFVLFLGVAVWITEPACRRGLIAIGAAVGLAAVGWLIVRGGAGGVLAPMDAEWLAVLAGKDYLFPTRDWAADAWLANLGTAGIAIGGLWARVRRGVGVSRERGLLAGAMGLLAVFLATLPAVAAGSALFVQLQISRVFWLLELLAVVVVAGVILDSRRDPASSSDQRWRAAVAAALVVVAVARGGFVALVERAGRPVISLTLPDEDWTRVVKWSAAQPAAAHFLADPGHAWRYGAPLRYSGRDVFVEDVKDSAMAIYSREAAHRLLERQRALGDFSTIDDARGRALAAMYDVDFLVIDRDLALPRVHQDGRFRVYRLR
jgi:hypothetical protein